MSPTSDIRLRAWHKVTAYHWRRDRRSTGTVLGICSCGWKARFLRKVEWRRRRRMVTQFCWLRGHDLGEVETVHAGPVGFEESDDTLLGAYRQCTRCYETKDVRP